MNNLKNMVLTLAGAGGTSGDENEIIEKIKAFLPDCAETQRDALGNLTASIKGSGKTFLLDAHADRIGMVVTSVEEGGFLRVAKCGGMDARVLAAQDVTVWGKEPVYGVLTSTPPHLSVGEERKKAVDFDKILIDVGMSKENAEKLISAGDRITVRCPQGSLQNNRVFSGALDNRSGCAVIIRAAEIIADASEHPSVKLLFSVQEETGGGGAATGSFNISADEAIAVDVSFAEAPGMPSDKCGKLGKGPMIGIAPVLSYEMSCKLQIVAKEKNIPYQLEIMEDSTGTDADHIAVSRGGIKTGLVSIPERNMHTGAEIVDLNDVENCALLIAEYVLGGGLDA